MNKAVITKRQAIWLMFMCIFSEPLVVHGHTWAKQDTWISMIISIFISLFISIIFIYLLSKKPGKDIFDISEEITGKVIGRIFSLLFIIYAIFIGSFTLRKIANFILTLSFPETPLWFLEIFIMVIVIFIVYLGIEVIGRGVNVLGPITIVTAIIGTLFLSKMMEIQNIKPILSEPWGDIITGSVKNIFICFGDLALLLGVVISERPKGNIFKAFFWGNILGGVMYLMIEITNILVLGAGIYNKLLYPTYSAYTLIDVAKFITRIQVILSAILTITLIIKTALSLFVATNGLRKVFKKTSHKPFILPIALAFIVLGIIMFKNPESMFEFKSKYSWTKGPFQIILPLLLTIIIFVKNIFDKINNDKKTSHV